MVKIKIEGNCDVERDLATKGFHIYSCPRGFGMSEYHLKKRIKEDNEKFKTF